MAYQRNFKVPVYSSAIINSFSHDGMMDNDIDSQRLHPERADSINVRLRKIDPPPMALPDISEQSTLEMFPSKLLDDNELEQEGYQYMSEILSANNPKPKND